MVTVGAEGDLCDVDVAIGHGELTEVFFAARFAAGCEFCDSAARSRFRGLTARVGVDFGVEDEDVDVASEAEDVVEAAVADVVCPAVAADDPEGALEEVIGLCHEHAGVVGVDLRKFGFELCDVRADAIEVGVGLLGFFAERFDEFVANFGGEFFEEVAREVAALVEG